MCTFMYVAFGLPLMGCWLFDIFINSWYFSACTTTNSINMMNFHINICDQKNPLISLLDILNIDTVCSKCLLMPSEDLYMILDDHTPGFKQASFIWRIKKCQNILGAGFHGDKIIKNPMQMYMYYYSTQKGGVGGYTLKVFEIGEQRLAGTNVQVCSKCLLLRGMWNTLNGPENNVL